MRFLSEIRERAVLLALGLAAGYVSVRRAGRIDPVQTLKAE